MKKICIILACLSAAGCSYKARSVEYYQNHPSEINAVLMKCESGKHQETVHTDQEKSINCANAFKAGWMKN